MEKEEVLITLPQTKKAKTRKEEDKESEIPEYEVKNFKILNSFSRSDLKRFGKISRTFLKDLQCCKEKEEMEPMNLMSTITKFYQSLQSRFGLRFDETEHPNRRFLQQCAKEIQERKSPDVRKLVILWCPKKKNCLWQEEKGPTANCLNALMEPVEGGSKRFHIVNMRLACNNGLKSNDHNPAHASRKVQEMYLRTFLQAMTIMGQKYDTLVPMCSSAIECIFGAVDKYKFCGTPVHSENIRGPMGKTLRGMKGVKPNVLALHHPGYPLNHVKDKRQQKQFLLSLSHAWGTVFGVDVPEGVLENLVTGPQEANHKDKVSPVSCARLHHMHCNKPTVNMKTSQRLQVQAEGGDVEEEKDKKSSMQEILTNFESRALETETRTLKGLTTLKDLVASITKNCKEPLPSEFRKICDGLDSRHVNPESRKIRICVENLSGLLSKDQNQEGTFDVSISCFNRVCTDKDCLICAAVGRKESQKNKARDPEEQRTVRMVIRFLLQLVALTQPNANTLEIVHDPRVIKTRVRTKKGNWMLSPRSSTDRVLRLLQPVKGNPSVLLPPSLVGKSLQFTKGDMSTLHVQGMACQDSPTDDWWNVPVARKWEKFQTPANRPIYDREEYVQLGQCYGEHLIQESKDCREEGDQQPSKKKEKKEKRRYVKANLKDTEAKKIVQDAAVSVNELKAREQTISYLLWKMACKLGRNQQLRGHQYNSLLSAARVQMSMYQHNLSTDGPSSREAGHWLSTPTGIEGAANGDELEIVALLFRLPAKQTTRQGEVGGKAIRRICEVSGLMDHGRKAFCPLYRRLWTGNYTYMNFSEVDEPARILTTGLEILDEGWCVLKSCRYPLSGIVRFSGSNLKQIWEQANLYRPKDCIQVQGRVWVEWEEGTLHKAYKGKGSSLIPPLLLGAQPDGPIKELVQNTLRNKYDTRYFDKELRKTPNVHLEESEVHPEKSFQRLVLSSDKIDIQDKDVIVTICDKPKKQIRFKDTTNIIPLLDKGMSYCVEVVLSGGSEVSMRQCGRQYNKLKRKTPKIEEKKHACACVSSKNPFDVLREMDERSDSTVQETESICLHSGSTTPSEASVERIKDHLIKQQVLLKKRLAKDCVPVPEEDATIATPQDTANNPETMETAHPMDSESNEELLRRRKVCHEYMLSLGDDGAKSNSRGTCHDNQSKRSLRGTGKGKDYVDYVSGQVTVQEGNDLLEKKLDASSKLLSLTTFTHETLYSLFYKLNRELGGQEGDSHTMGAETAEATFRKVYRQNEKIKNNLEPSLEMSAWNCAETLEDTLARRKLILTLVYRYMGLFQEQSQGCKYYVYSTLKKRKNKAQLLYSILLTSLHKKEEKIGSAEKKQVPVILDRFKRFVTLEELSLFDGMDGTAKKLKAASSSSPIVIIQSTDDHEKVWWCQFKEKLDLECQRDLFEAWVNYIQSGAPKTSQSPPVEIAIPKKGKKKGEEKKLVTFNDLVEALKVTKPKVKETDKTKTDEFKVVVDMPKDFGKLENLDSLFYYLAVVPTPNLSLSADLGKFVEEKEKFVDNTTGQSLRKFETSRRKLASYSLHKENPTTDTQSLKLPKKELSLKIKSGLHEKSLKFGMSESSVYMLHHLNSCTALSTTAENVDQEFIVGSKHLPSEDGLKSVLMDLGERIANVQRFWKTVQVGALSPGLAQDNRDLEDEEDENKDDVEEEEMEEEDRDAVTSEETLKARKLLEAMAAIKWKLLYPLEMKLVKNELKATRKEPATSFSHKSVWTFLKFMMTNCTYGLLPQEKELDSTERLFLVNRYNALTANADLRQSKGKKGETFPTFAVKVNQGEGRVLLEGDNTIHDIHLQHREVQQNYFPTKGKTEYLLRYRTETGKREIWWRLYRRKVNLPITLRLLRKEIEKREDATLLEASRVVEVLGCKIRMNRMDCILMLKKPHDLIFPKEGHQRGVSTLLNLKEFDYGFDFSSIAIHSNESGEMSISGPYGREREKRTKTSSASDMGKKEGLNVKGSLPQEDKQQQNPAEHFTCWSCKTAQTDNKPDGVVGRRWYCCASETCRRKHERYQEIRKMNRISRDNRILRRKMNAGRPASGNVHRDYTQWKFIKGRDPELLKIYEGCEPKFIRVWRNPHWKENLERTSKFMPGFFIYCDPGVRTFLSCYVKNTGDEFLIGDEKASRLDKQFTTKVRALQSITDAIKDTDKELVCHASNFNDGSADRKLLQVLRKMLRECRKELAKEKMTQEDQDALLYLVQFLKNQINHTPTVIGILNQIKTLRHAHKDRVKGLHQNAAKFLSAYKLTVLPKFDTGKMSQRREGKRKISSDVVREMMSLAHSEFRDCLLRAVYKRGTRVLWSTEEYSSKICSQCWKFWGGLGAAKLYHCPNSKCRHVGHRDVGGAQSIDIAVEAKMLRVLYGLQARIRNAFFLTKSFSSFFFSFFIGFRHQK